jgi:hypothetical protein
MSPFSGIPIAVPPRAFFLHCKDLMIKMPNVTHASAPATAPAATPALAAVVKLSLAAAFSAPEVGAFWVGGVTEYDADVDVGMEVKGEEKLDFGR